mgnify:CR=1 FL=1
MSRNEWLSTGAVREALTMSCNECLSTGAVREAENVSQRMAKYWCC